MPSLRPSRASIFAGLLLALPAAGCHLFGSGKSVDDNGVRGLGVGQMCMRSAECRVGLSCAVDSMTCQPKGDVPLGGPCTLTAECEAGHYCAPMGTANVCADSGPGKAGDSCGAEGSCSSGLVCDLQGLYGQCTAPGTGNLAADCGKLLDCMAGLVCTAGKCSKGGPPMPWAGVTCATGQEDVPRVYFEVPRPSKTPADFFRLPFPNDVRKKAGKLDLADFPRPGVQLLPFDLVDRYIKVVEQDVAGFSTNAPVFFRFSRDMNFESLRKPNAVQFVDISKGSPGYGKNLGYFWSGSTGGGKYICPRFIAVHPPLGAPLRPATTYAVILRNIVTDTESKSMQADGDFRALLGATTPSDVELGPAWTAYAPLRDYLTDKMVDPMPIVAAAVFTTQDTEQPLAKLRDAVRAAAAPAVKGLVRCGDAGKVSPCDDGKTGAEHLRGCPTTADPMVDEYQMTIGVPQFQAGTAPFETPDDGGAVAVDAGGVPKVVGSHDVCASLTVPKGSAPAAGWPVLLYAHGTDGDYRSAVKLGLGAEAATTLVGGSAAAAAVLSWDGVMHGDRRGASTKKPGDLVYNFANPRAARDNTLQGAADVLAVARVVEGWTGAGVSLDAAKIVFYGHSQGATAGALAVPYEPLVGATVLSGAGGSLTHSLLFKKNPVNIAAALPIILGEGGIDDSHPVLAIMQTLFDRVDPVNFARHFVIDPVAGQKRRHVVQTYGTGDTWTPPRTMQAWLWASGLPVLKVVLDDFGAPQVTGPVTGNFNLPSGKITALQAQYMPGATSDGHFVATQDATARAALRAFVGTFIKNGVPTYGN